MKNLGTFGAAFSTFLLLGHSITSNIPFIGAIAWKLIAFLISVLIAVGIAFVVNKETKNQAIALFSGLASLAGLLIIVGAVT